MEVIKMPLSDPILLRNNIFVSRILQVYVQQFKYKSTCFEWTHLQSEPHTSCAKTTTFLCTSAHFISGCSFWLGVTPHWGMCVLQEAAEGHNTAAEPPSTNVKLG
jgi:hypothetical protein